MPALPWKSFLLYCRSMCRSFTRTSTSTSRTDQGQGCPACTTTSITTRCRINDRRKAANAGKWTEIRNIRQKDLEEKKTVQSDACFLGAAQTGTCISKLGQQVGTFTHLPESSSFIANDGVPILTTTASIHGCALATAAPCSPHLFNGPNEQFGPYGKQAARCIDRMPQSINP
eukprot:364310-Chlamydomonas_euryale.AAC.10